MKIFDSGGNELCDLPDKPKNFNGGHKAGVVDIIIGEDSVKLGRYTPEAAERIVHELCKAYVGKQPEFTMPAEGQEQKEKG